MKKILLLLLLLLLSLLGITQCKKIQTYMFLEKAAKGDLIGVQKYIENGYNVNAKDKSSYTALIEAASHGHIDIVKYLILKNADTHSIAADATDVY